METVWGGEIGKNPGRDCERGLKWNEHIDIITVKASEAHGCWQSITDLIFLSCIKSVLEYACQSFHSSLPAY